MRTLEQIKADVKAQYAKNRGAFCWATLCRVIAGGAVIAFELCVLYPQFIALSFMGHFNNFTGWTLHYVILIVPFSLFAFRAISGIKWICFCASNGEQVYMEETLKKTGRFKTMGIVLWPDIRAWKAIAPYVVICNPELNLRKTIDASKELMKTATPDIRSHCNKIRIINLLRRTTFVASWIMLYVGFWYPWSHGQLCLWAQALFAIWPFLCIGNTKRCLTMANIYNELVVKSEKGE